HGQVADDIGERDDPRPLRRPGQRDDRAQAALEAGTESGPGERGPGEEARDVVGRARPQHDEHAQDHQRGAGPREGPGAAAVEGKTGEPAAADDEKLSAAARNRTARGGKGPRYRRYGRAVE